jgi:hypothetical protein
MNDAPKAPASPAAFDAAAWREEVLALNEWARGLRIDEGDETFAAARQAATLARHGQGEEVWNEWANAAVAGMSGGARHKNGVRSRDIASTSSGVRQSSGSEQGDLLPHRFQKTRLRIVDVEMMAVE